MKTEPITDTHPRVPDTPIHSGASVNIHTLKTCLITLMLILIFGCTVPSVREAPEAPPPPPPPAQPPAEPQQKAAPPPLTLQMLSGALERLETRFNIEFFRTANGRHMPYLISGEDRFSIPDKTGNCLYDIVIVQGKTAENHSESPLPTTQILPELDWTPGPCGLSFPDLDAAVLKQVSESGSGLIYPALLSRLDSAGKDSNCTEKDFISQTLRLPYVFSEDSPLEAWLTENATPVVDPFDLAFGDLVIAESADRQARFGIYAGHGVVVQHEGCNRASLYRMAGSRPYRAYRLMTGFAWTRHRIHGDDFLKRLFATHQDAQ